MSELRTSIEGYIVQGLKPAQIAKQVGCSAAYVYNIKYGQPCRSGKRYLNRKQAIKAAYLWGQGDLGAVEIARRLEVYPAAVARFIEDEGLLNA